MKQGKPYDARVSQELLDLLKNWIKEHKLIHDNFIFYPEQLYKRDITKAEKEAYKINQHVIKLCRATEKDF